MELSFDDFEKEAFVERAKTFVPVHPLTDESRQKVWRHLIVDSRYWQPGNPRVICSVLGELMAMLGDDPDIRERLLTATDMGMRITTALYKNKARVAELEKLLKEHGISSCQPCPDTTPTSNPSSPP